MNKRHGLFKHKFSVLIITALLFFPYLPLVAQEINANSLIPRANVSVSPKTGSFVEGSNVEISVLLDTKGNEVNSVDITISFDPSRLSVIKPSGGLSIVGLWIEPPSFNNSRGVINYTGVIPNGIKSSAGVIGTITFQALRPGRTTVSVRSNSRVLLNDGAGTEATLEFDRGDFVIIPKAPEGLSVFSETHPFSSEWYRNNNLIVSWEKESGVSAFTYILDNMPNTNPQEKETTTETTTETTASFSGLSDGLHYFHIRANRGGVWGGTSHFLAKVDTIPPAVFTPQVNYVLASASMVDRALISFLTTDSLSGISHYEVGVINKRESVNVSPVFVRSESPYQVLIDNNTDYRVIVRAVDNAGNIRESYVDIAMPGFTWNVIINYLPWILLSAILIILAFALIHHFFKIVFRSGKDIESPSPNKEEAVYHIPYDK